MPRKRVLFFIESLAGGGAERVLTTMIEHLDQSLFSITVCPVVRTGIYIDKIKAYARIQPIINNSRSLIGRLKYWLIYYVLPPSIVYFLFVPKNFDVEIAFVEGFATRVLSRSTNHRCCKLSWVHTDLINNHWTDIAYRSREEEADAYTRFDKVVCVSDSVKESMQKVNPSLNSLTVLYNPVDVESIKSLSKEAINDNRYLRGVFNLVSLGRLVPQKGYDRLLPILKHLHDDGYDFVMNILGDGPDKMLLERLIYENDMGDYVRLVGFKSNPYPFLRSSDLFVCSSRCEGYSTAVTESLSLSLPVITTLCSGMTELLEGGCGMIVDNNNDALYEGLKQLLSDKDVYYRYKRNAEHRSLLISLENQMKPIEEILLS